MKRIIVLGSRGMLGHMVLRHLRQIGMHVEAFNDRWTPENHQELSKKLATQNPDVCINAIGIRHGKGSKPEQLMWINGSLPGIISKNLPKECSFIHASSDAVFSSDHKGCRWDAPHNPDTDYGRSKQMGERGLRRENDWIIRCSIIGPEIDSQRSLLNWFLNQNQSINGFTNQLWNGITTLQWAQLCQQIINGERIGFERILQPGFLPPISKYSLLKLIGRIYQHPVEINPILSDSPVQRSLIPNIYGASLKAQLGDLAKFE